MLMSTVCAALAVFVGSTTGTLDVLAVLVALAWSFGAGLLVAEGPAATQIGLTSIVVLLVFSAQPASPAKAAGLAALVVVGGILQTLLAVTAWPLHPFAPQRAAVISALRALATIARRPIDPAAAPPATAEFTNSRTALSMSGSSANASSMALHSLLNRVERIRLLVLALDDTRRLSRHTSPGMLAHRIDDVLDTGQCRA